MNAGAVACGTLLTSACRFVPNPAYDEVRDNTQGVADESGAFDGAGTGADQADLDGTGAADAGAHCRSA